MIDFKKMDEKDFVFLNKPLSEADEKDFSEFLKSRNVKLKQAQKPKKFKVSVKK